MSARRIALPDLATVMPYAGAVLLILGGSTFFPQMLGLGYLAQQLQIAAFLGVIALGATVVILLGHIDLSVPWVLGGAALISTTLAGTGDAALTALAIPAALLFGLCIGLVNALGVAVLRIPSMVWTLAINAMLLGISVLYTGGFNPKGEASATMIWLASGKIAGVPAAFIVWMAVAVLLGFMLHRTAFGRYLSAIGYNEKATFLSGVSTPSVVFSAFAIAGLCSALGGVLLAGYANQAYQSMGDPYLLPTIAAVVIGGTSILGGSGGLAGTIGGVFFITLLNSILSVMQISDAWRSITFGLIILAMLLAQTLRSKET